MATLCWKLACKQNVGVAFGDICRFAHFSISTHNDRYALRLLCPYALVRYVSPDDGSSLLDTHICLHIQTIRWCTHLCIGGCCTIDTHKRPLTVIWFCCNVFSFQYQPPNHSNVCSFCPYTFVLVSLTFWYVLRGIMAERLMGFRIEENAMNLCVKSSAHDQPEWLPFGQVEARLDERMKADFKIVQGEYRKFFSLPTWFGWLVF